MALGRNGITTCENPSTTGCNFDFSRVNRLVDPLYLNFSKNVLEDYVNEAMKQKSFEEFSRFADMAHTAIHRGLKCSMQHPDTTAYDPTFWMHHTMLDKLFADWQANTRNEVSHT